MRRADSTTLRVTSGSALCIAGNCRAGLWTPGAPWSSRAGRRDNGGGVGLPRLAASQMKRRYSERLTARYRATNLQCLGQFQWRRFSPISCIRRGLRIANTNSLALPRVGLTDGRIVLWEELTVLLTSRKFQPAGQHLRGVIDQYSGQWRALYS
jgi:hypothetical protein